MYFNVEMYVDIEVSSTMLLLRNEAVSVSNLQYSYAAVEFKNNTISIAEYSRVHEANVK